MSKTYRRDSKNAGWRRAKLERENKKYFGHKPEYSDGPKEQDEHPERFTPNTLPDYDRADFLQ